MAAYNLKEPEKTERVIMKYWIAYLKEKKTNVILCIVTVTLFLLLGSLGHMENQGLLCYGAGISLFLWSMAGIFGGWRYVRQCRRLEGIIHSLEKSPELIGDLLWEKEDHWAAAAVEDATREGELLKLIRFVCASQEAQRRSWEEKSADRNDYYSMWTHQIKTPIAAMRLLLEENGAGERNGFLLREELFQIEQYVEMVLAYQRLESISADLVLQECELQPMLRQAVRKFSVAFINKGLKLALDEQETIVVTDEKWFIFCLEQFLSNSVKYTSAGKISIWTEKRGAETVLCLEDTGIGIRSEDLPRIFEKGFTGYNGRLDKRSTGIGLYLCSRVLKHLGIAVAVSSQVGEGTRVELTLVQTYKNVS